MQNEANTSSELSPQARAILEGKPHGPSKVVVGKPVAKPDPSGYRASADLRPGDTGGSDSSSGTTPGNDATRTVATPTDPFIRAANEDDDGYDPYSDRPAVNPRYEEDPWK